MTHALSVAPACIVCWGQTRRAREMPIQHGIVPPEEPAVLGRCLKTLYVLWDEYINGIGGLKHAREFTCHHERGLKQNKFKYCNQLIVWKYMEGLIIRGGNTVAVAVRKINRVYGKTCVTMLIRKMRWDERNDSHLQLCRYMHSSIVANSKEQVVDC